MILVIAPAALAELDDATQFYVSIGGPPLGSSFIAEFERTANLILGNAGLGTPVRGALRRIPLGLRAHTCPFPLPTDYTWKRFPS